MNIAYLILAHNQPHQLERLIKRLYQPNAYFYIHVDLKSKDLTSIINNLSGYENVTILSKYNVNWMGFNMVKSTLSLINAAYSSKVQFKYYVLLSGQDYPIKSNSYINHFFESHNTDFISYNQLSHMSEPLKDKVRHYHFPDIQYTNPRSPKKLPALVWLYYGFQKRLKKLLPRRPFYKGYEPFFGSQWFALTHGTIEYILRFTSENKGYMKFMKYTEGPDEMFFQTIILNSERKANLYDYDKYIAWLKTRKDNEVFIPGYSSLRYMDWSERGKPKPAVLDMGYYQTLKESGELFARKMDETASAELLDKIDTNLVNEI